MSTVYEQLKSAASAATSAKTPGAVHVASGKNVSIKSFGNNKGVSNSQKAYLTGKKLYGSSSAWYDSAAQTAKDKQSFVDKLKQDGKFR